MLKIRRLGKEIDQKATVEHMHQSTKASQRMFFWGLRLAEFLVNGAIVQALENQKAEDFREGSLARIKA